MYYSLNNIQKIVLIDSRTRTYNPHPYLGLYDGYACFRLEPYLATDTLLFQLGNINQNFFKKRWGMPHLPSSSVALEMLISHGTLLDAQPQSLSTRWIYQNFRIRQQIF